MRGAPVGRSKHHDAGLQALGRGRRDEAATLFLASARAREPKSELSLLRLIQLLEAGQSGKLISILEELDGQRKLSPRFVGHLAKLQMNSGRYEAAVASADRSLAADPTQEDVFVNRACWMASRSASLDEVRRGFEAWGQRFADPLTAAADQPPITDPDPERILKVGYVSGDLGNHSIRYFLEPYLRTHDRSRFEIHAFMTLAEDAVSEFLHPLVDHWHSVQKLDDDALLRLIRTLGIDILVDMSGHTRGERLRVFARRAAPIQLTWIGFMNTLGMKAIDYRITDLGAAPPGTEAGYTEKLWRLQAMTAYHPPLNCEQLYDSPRHQNGYVTMVSLNHMRKISDEALAVWSAILQENPACGLLIVGSESDAESSMRLIRPRLEQAQMPMDRVTVIERQTMTGFMRMASIADFALDAFPISGGTTTLHSLWMGLPVLSLMRLGRPATETSSALTLQGIGMPECVAVDLDDYRRKAGQWIQDADLNDQIRTRCRPALQASGLMQHGARTKELEAAYRSMWRTLVGQHAAPAFEQVCA